MAPRLRPRDRMGHRPDDAPPTRPRCRQCGNLTRFDVVATTRTRAFHHYSIGGELRVEDEELIEQVVESLTCRWCGSSDVEQLDVDAG